MRLPAPWLIPVFMAVAAGLASAAPEPLPHVSLEANELRLQLVLRFFERIPLRVTLDPKISDVPVTVSIRKQPADEALRALFEAARREVPDLQLVEKEGAYRIQLKPGGTVPPYRPRRPAAGTARQVNAAFGNLPLSEAVELIYRQPNAPAAKPPVEIERDVPDRIINLVYSDDTEAPVLRFAVRQAATTVRDLRLEQKDGRFVVGIRPNPQREPPPPIRTNLPPPGLKDQRIVLGFRAAPLRYVLRAVLDTTLPAFGPTPEYVLVGDPPDVPITFTLVTLSAEQALETTLAEIKKQARGVNLRRENGSLIVTGPVP